MFSNNLKSFCEKRDAFDISFSTGRPRYIAFRNFTDFSDKVDSNISTLPPKLNYFIGSSN